MRARPPCVAFGQPVDGKAVIRILVKKQILCSPVRRHAIRPLLRCRDYVRIGQKLGEYRPQGIPTLVEVRFLSEEHTGFTHEALHGIFTLRLQLSCRLGFHLYRNFKPPFFLAEQYRRTGGMSIVFLVDENPNVASAGLGDSVCVLHSPRQRNHADNTHGLRRSTDSYRCSLPKTSPSCSIFKSVPYSSLLTCSWFTIRFVRGRT